MRAGSALVGLALALASLGPASVGFAQQSSRAYVLDSGARKAAEIPLPDLRGLFFPPDRSVGMALA